MNVSYILDDVCWTQADLSQDTFSDVLDAFLQRIESISALPDREEIFRLESFNELKLHPDLDLMAFVYDPFGLSDHLPQLDRDLMERLRLALDRISIRDDLPEYLDATYDGQSFFTPAVCWAHAQRCQKQSVAVLTLPLHKLSGGLKDVYVNDICAPIHFVTDLQEELNFVRAAVTLQGLEVKAFAAVCHRCFPALAWSDTALVELGHWTFFELYRERSIRHLAVLNDYGAKLFHEHRGGQGVDSALGSLHVEASTENGRTRADKECARDRTRPFEGQALVFWWHTKLTKPEGRIHFTHLPAPPSAQDIPPEGRIIIGIFTDHCKLLE